MGNYWVQVGIVQIIIFAILFFIMHTCILSIRWWKNPKKCFGYSNHWFLLCSSILSLFVYYETVTKTSFAPRFYYTWQTGHTDLSQENINGLKLHQSINDDWFVSRYGKEYGRIDNVLFDYYKLKDGLMIATQKGDDKIIRIIANEGLRTGKGITNGDSIEKVKQLYGDNYYTRQEQGSRIIGYVDVKETLEFWYGNNKVQMIRYDISSMD